MQQLTTITLVGSTLAWDKVISLLLPITAKFRNLE